MRARGSSRILSPGAAVVLLLPGAVWGQDYGRTSTGRGIGFSSRDQEREADRTEDPGDRGRRWQPRDRGARGRGILGSPSNARQRRCERAKTPQLLEKRGARPTRLGLYAPWRAEYVRDFREALRRVTSIEIEPAQGVRDAAVWTATPPQCIPLEHAEYGTDGLYRGTLRDTFRGSTIVRYYDYREGLGPVDGFWMRFLLEHAQEKIYALWFYHNWEQLPVDDVRAQLGQDLYEVLLRRLAAIEAEGVERSPRGYYLEIPDRDALAFLERHPGLAQRFYRATFALDTSQ